MFDQSGLSLDQAPPIKVVFGLFLTGALFGIVAGFGLLWWGMDIFDSSSTAAVVTVHLLALGVMMSMMLGALFQMLPVIAGVVLESPVFKSTLIRHSMTLGVFALIAGFVLAWNMLFVAASVLLGGSLLYTVWIMGRQLFKLSNHSSSSRGMLFAVISLGVLTILALYMTIVYSGMIEGELFLQIKQMHYSFALFGWVALLIASISFQTIEMFYVTPPYPKILSRYMPAATLYILVLFSAATIFGLPHLSVTMQLFIYLLFALYGSITLLRLSQRKRPLADATIWFWRIGMSSLIISMALHLAALLLDSSTLISVANILFISFVFSVLFAMLYKIIPFLTWFHLNSQGYLTAPMMHEVIHPKTAKKHLWIHIGMISALLISMVASPFIYLAGLLLSVSFGWVAYQILHAQRLYKHTQENSEKFEFPAMDSK